MAIFAISTQRMEWLSARQSAIASNIANADTPGYRARDVAPFSSYLDGSQFDLAVTSPDHQSTNSGQRFPVQTSARSGGEVKHSGNTVSLERELIRAGQVQSDHTLAASIVKSFHQMLASAVRG